MALRTPASWIQGGSHTAENDRLTERADTMVAGIIGAPDLAVSANGTPNMSVNVAAGAAFVAGSITATQGLYKAYNDGTVNLAVTASNASNPRIDIVVVTINDAQYSGVTNSAVLQVVAGTPAASPVAPAAPANSLILAQILVGAAVTSINSGNITDTRTKAVNKAPVFQAEVAAAVGLIVRGAVSQSADLLQAQNSSSVVLARMNVAGSFATAGTLTVGSATVQGSAGGFIAPYANNIVGLVVQGLSGQSVDLQQWQNNTGALLAKVDNAGNIFATNLTNAWITYTPTFANCTSPAGNFAYRQIGKTVLIRAQFTGGTVTATGAISFTVPAMSTGSAGATVLTGITPANAFIAFPVASGVTAVASASITAGTALSGYVASGVVEVL